ncbi:MAG: transglutaminase domain-containing protein [Chitinophagales bacterium]
MKHLLPKDTLFTAILTITLLLFGLQLKAQTDFEKADSIAANFEEVCETPEDLAQKLTATLTTPEEKARVFYMWITHNIRYDCRQYHNPKPVTIKAATDEDYDKKVAEWQKKQILKTIKFKKGICEDYSRLFKAMCEEVGLESIVIQGDARDFNRPYQSEHDNPHAWNSVKIGDTWHLLDATWGAGKTNAEFTKFTREVSTKLFFTPPALFIQDHFPKEAKWQLLNSPLSKEDFANQAAINYANVNYSITDFAPQVEDQTGKKKTVWLQFEEIPKVIAIANKKGKQIEFERVEQDGKLTLSFPASKARSITIYGGKTYKNKLQWLAKYEL